MRHKVLSLDTIPADRNKALGVTDCLFDAAPEDGANERQRRARLVCYAIEHELTDRQREFVRLYFYGGLTLKQTGAALGVTEAAACKRINKALDRLRHVLRYADLARGVLE